MLYVKRALPVEAKQWFHPGDEPVGVNVLKTSLGCYPRPFDYYIRTLEGPMLLTPGCYIVGPGAEGEYWAVKQSIFEKTYIPYDESLPNLLKPQAE